ncbi:hypothetical protein FNF28_07704 [Cafeteria roenbergensis]|uniref:Flavin-containing monooxygenase n=1 Tax=Cafeteria roenbergensis TaxID=33653 RepID=A0A5A8C0P4_CAFRO|nr:hypothetical protein FNF28_07704 [Cafeteria roenbergensis]
MASRSRAVVVGAGAAGLISARHLLREGLSVTVLEQSDRVGGIWTHHDVPGCPVYDSLRTNLPSSVMGLSDWPFPEQVPSFMPHAHVGDFLTSYAEAKGVVPHVRLRHTVTRVEAIPAAPARCLGDAASGGAADGASKRPASVGACLRDPPRYRVTATVRPASAGPLAGVTLLGPDGATATQASPSAASQMEGQQLPAAAAAEAEAAADAEADAATADHTTCETATFDADVVVVCNGHYSDPVVPPLPGADRLRGASVHSVHYRRPSQFRDQRVMVVGSGPSGSDMVAELQSHCPQVWLATREATAAQEAASLLRATAAEPADKAPRGSGLLTCGAPSRVDSDGAVVTALGGRVEVDSILWCTGYRYNFGAEPGAQPAGDAPSAPASRSAGFLEPVGIRVDPEGKAVSPLYLGLFHAHQPGIALVGIPWRVNPFPLFDYQASLVAAVAAGRTTLPNLEHRLAELQAWNSYIRDGLALPERFTHMLGGLQWDYCMALHGMLSDETAGRAHERWVALLRAGTERGSAASPELAAAGSDPEWLATMPASQPRETAEVDVPAADAGAAAADGSVGVAAALAAMADRPASLTPAEPLSTWGGPAPMRLSRDRAVYLNVSAARAVDATRYRKREYRFRGKPPATELPEAAPVGAGAASSAHAGETSSPAAGAGGASVRATVEVHGDFVVTAPVETASEEALADSSSRLMATPF